MFPLLMLVADPVLVLVGLALGAAVPAVAVLEPPVLVAEAVVVVVSSVLDLALLVEVSVPV
jgi:hypothetical protein